MSEEPKKPKAHVTGKDGNVFILTGICSQALKRAGMREESKKMIDEIFSCDSYDEALQIMGKYCESC